MVNKKKIIVCAVGSWHGSVDQTLFSPKKNLSPFPISSGLNENDRKNILFITGQFIPYAKSIGGVIRVYSFLQTLKKK